MTDPGAARETPRSGGGCATALGVALVLAGGLFLWANLSDTPLALVLLDLLPLAAMWWPLLLVAWGAAKVIARLRTGRARFGFGEGFLLLLLIFTGTSLTLAQGAIESQGLEPRLGEVRRLIEQQSGRFSQHVFVTERTVSLPTGEGVDFVIALPAGNIRVEAATAAREDTGVDPDAETGSEATPGNAETKGHLRLVKRVWAADGPEARTRADAVRLRSGPLDPETRRFPVEVEDSGAFEVALELLATLPPGVRVSALTEEGWVRIDGPFPRVEARAENGPVEVRGTGGPVSITVRDGAVWASGIEGALEIQARRAAVEVDSVAGTATVDAEGAPVWISEAGSGVTVRGRNAPVTIADSFGPIEVETRISPIALDRIGGSAVLRSDFGDIVATSIEGRLRIRTESAGLEVRRARSAVDVQAAGGTLVIDEVAGPLTVASGRGEVRASQLLGPANFTGDAGAITVRGFGDNLSVAGGDAEVDAATGALGGEVALTTGRGDIRLTLPSAGSFAFSAETEDGDLDSDFALERHETGGTSHWEGRTGSGAERVAISTREGDITVRAHPLAGEEP